jgi:methyl-accepting chemotaxis protein
MGGVRFASDPLGTGFVSMPPPSADPPEEPTRPLPPPTPARARPVYEREVAAPVEDPYRTEIVLSRLRSLRTAVMIVGLIAIAALAVAVYAVLTMEEENDAGGGASRQQVADLDDRVDALEAEVEDRATGDDVNRIADDVQALSDRVDQVAKQARSAASTDNSGTDEQARSSIDQLNQSLTDLDERVRDLEVQAQQQPP